MASKVVVVKSGNFDAVASAEKLSAELAALVAQLKEITGVRKDGKTGLEFAEKTFVIEPTTKSEILGHLKYLGSPFMADKKLAGVGREPKADLANLQRIYVDYVRQHPSQKGELATMHIAMKYNEGREEKDHITGSYVARNAKTGGWNDLVNVPEPATA